MSEPLIECEQGCIECFGESDVERVVPGDVVSQLPRAAEEFPMPAQSPHSATGLALRRGGRWRFGFEVAAELSLLSDRLQGPPRGTSVPGG